MGPIFDSGKKVTFDADDLIAYTQIIMKRGFLLGVAETSYDIKKEILKAFNEMDVEPAAINCFAMIGLRNTIVPILDSK